MVGSLTKLRGIIRRGGDNFSIERNLEILTIMLIFVVSRIFINHFIVRMFRGHQRRTRRVGATPLHDQLIAEPLGGAFFA